MVYPSYRLWLSYDGTDYGGWQRQPNRIAIQAVLEEALSIALREAIHTVGAGRTDAGVHARRQCCHFQTSQPISSCWRLRASLNGLLPKEIRVMEIEEVAKEFHARYSAVGKWYRYQLQLASVASPFVGNYSWHLPIHNFDRERLRQALPHLVGYKDFAAFANEAKLRGEKTVRHLWKAEWSVGADGLDYLDFVGEGFLYKMVRNLVGFLVEVSQSKRSADELPELLASRDRRQASQAAPARGLFLMDVFYP